MQREPPAEEDRPHRRPWSRQDSRSRARTPVLVRARPRRARIRRRSSSAEDSREPSDRGGSPRSSARDLLRPARARERSRALLDAAILLCDRATVDGAAYWPGPGELWTCGRHHARRAARALRRRDSSAHAAGQRRLQPSEPSARRNRARSGRDRRADRRCMGGSPASLRGGPDVGFSREGETRNRDLAARASARCQLHLPRLPVFAHHLQ